MLVLGRVYSLQYAYITLWSIGEVQATLPETNGLPLKMMVSNRNLLFQGSIFRGHVSFREGKMKKTKDVNMQKRIVYNSLFFLVEISS